MRMGWFSLRPTLTSCNSSRSPACTVVYIAALSQSVKTKAV